MANTLEEGRLHRLLEVGRTLVATLDPDEVLDRVLETARDLTGAGFAALGVLDENRKELERFVTKGLDDSTRREIGDLPRGRGILGLLIDEPSPLRIRDIGEHPSSFGFPSGHPPMRSFLGVPIIIRGEAWGNLYLTEKEDAEEFDEGDEQALVVLSEWAALAIDNARLYRQAEERRMNLERAVQGLEAATAIARSLAGETELERVLELVAKRARALIESRVVVVELVERDRLFVAATAGDAPEGLEDLEVPLERSMAREVIRRQQPERLSALAARRAKLYLEDWGLRFDAGVIVPLTFRGRAVGALAAFDRIIAGPEFTDQDERLLLGFAASAGTALGTAKSVERGLLERSVAAAEDERRRWARELHDETLQDLAGVQLLLSSSRRGNDPSTLADSVDKAIQQVGASMENLRHLISELRPAALDELGLGTALETLVDGITEPEVKLAVDLAWESGREQTRLLPEIETALYRMVQEALTNVVKHSDAHEVRIEVQERSRMLELAVSDDGGGFDPGSGSAGFGLVGMGERASQVGGTLTIDSRPGAGTTISAKVPATHLDGVTERIRSVS